MNTHIYLYSYKSIKLEPLEKILTESLKELGVDNKILAQEPGHKLFLSLCSKCTLPPGAKLYAKHDLAPCPT